jgi:hypothetical protein
MGDVEISRTIVRCLPGHVRCTFRSNRRLLKLALEELHVIEDSLRSTRSAATCWGPTFELDPDVSTCRSA